MGLPLKGVVEPTHDNFELCLDCVRQITVWHNGVLDHKEEYHYEGQRLQLKLGTYSIPRRGLEEEEGV